MPQISVIIPTLNEEANIAALIHDLMQQQDVSLEIIVVDGHSTDNTVSVVENFAVKVIQTESGRAHQMNTGAANACGQYLLFLHADCRLHTRSMLAHALGAIDQHQTTSRLAGHFSLRFHSTALRPFGLAYYEAKTKLNRKNTINGDQGFLIPKVFFEHLGGFDESLPLLEDQDLAERVRISGNWLLLPGVIETSARRFEREGLSRRMILSAILVAFHDTGLLSDFEVTKALYPAPGENRSVETKSFLKFIHQQNKRAAVKTALQRWLRIGKFVRENAWQLFFPIDILLSKFCKRNVRISLAFHDRIFAPLTNFRIFNAIAAALTIVWFYTTWCYLAVCDLWSPREQEQYSANSQESDEEEFHCCKRSGDRQ